MTYINKNGYTNKELIFYNHFNIRYKTENNGIKYNGCYEYEWDVYPPITPSIILGLIEIIIKNKLEFGCSYSEIHNTYFASKEDDKDNYLSCQEYNLKDAILSLCMNIDNIKPQVQELFILK